MGIYLDGDDRFDITSFSPPSTYGTIMFWVKLDSLPTAGQFMRFFGINDGFEARVDSNGYIYNDVCASGTTDATTDILSAGQWHHLTFCYNQSAVVNRTYIDASSQGDKTTNETPPTGTFSIGTRNGSTQNMIGVLEDFRIYNRVFTQEKHIKTIMACKGTDAIYDNLVHRYLFSGASDGSVATACKDTIGKKDGVAAGNPVYKESWIRFQRGAA